MVIRVRARQAGNIDKGGVAQLGFQAAVFKAFKLQFRHVLPVVLAVVDNLGQRRLLAVPQIINTKIAIRKAAAVRIDVGEGGHGVVRTADPQHPLLAR
ncbi:hypothetical protein D3C79_894320 [compost metagenome]